MLQYLLFRSFLNLNSTKQTSNTYRRGVSNSGVIKTKKTSRPRELRNTFVFVDDHRDDVREIRESRFLIDGSRDRVVCTARVQCVSRNVFVYYEHTHTHIYTLNQAYIYTLINLQNTNTHTHIRPRNAMSGAAKVATSFILCTPLFQFAQLYRRMFVNNLVSEEKMKIVEPGVWVMMVYFLFDFSFCIYKHN